jgi:hypothetical protein
VPSSEEALRTERIFRDANKSIGAVAEELAVNAQVPFLCECDDPACRQILRALGRSLPLSMSATCS